MRVALDKSHQKVLERMFDQIIVLNSEPNQNSRKEPNCTVLLVAIPLRNMIYTMIGYMNRATECIV